MDFARGSPRFHREAGTWLIALTFERNKRNELWVHYFNVEVVSMRLGIRDISVAERSLRLQWLMF